MINKINEIDESNHFIKKRNINLIFKRKNIFKLFFFVFLFFSFFLLTNKIETFFYFSDFYIKNKKTLNLEKKKELESNYFKKIVVHDNFFDINYEKKFVELILRFKDINCNDSYEENKKNCLIFKKELEVLINEWEEKYGEKNFIFNKFYDDYEEENLYKNCIYYSEGKKCLNNLCVCKNHIKYDYYTVSGEVTIEKKDSEFFAENIEKFHFKIEDENSFFKFIDFFLTRKFKNHFLRLPFMKNFLEGRKVLSENCLKLKCFAKAKFLYSLCLNFKERIEKKDFFSIKNIFSSFYKEQEESVTKTKINKDFVLSEKLIYFFSLEWQNFFFRVLSKTLDIDLFVIKAIEKKYKRKYKFCLLKKFIVRSFFKTENNYKKYAFLSKDVNDNTFFWIDIPLRDLKIKKNEEEK